MEKSQLTRAEEFVIEQIFEKSKSQFVNYHDLIDHLRSKIFDSFEREDISVSKMYSFEDMNRDMRETLKLNNDPILKYFEE